MVRLRLYGEIAYRLKVREVELKGAGKKVIDVLREFAERYGVKDLLFRDDKVRPEYLILIEGRDYRSLGLLGKVIECEDVEIKIVPTFHGGS